MDVMVSHGGMTGEISMQFKKYVWVFPAHNQTKKWVASYFFLRRWNLLTYFLKSFVVVVVIDVVVSVKR